HLTSTMRAHNCHVETRRLRERNCFREVACGDFNLVARFHKPRGECFEERNVRRVGEIDPAMHQGSELEFDEPAATAQRGLRGFDHAHPAQARWTTGVRLTAILTTLDEMQR